MNFQTVSTAKKTLRECVRTMLAHTRAKERLFGIGVECKGERTLVRMSNVQMNGGRLIDGLCHYQQRWYVRGNTYQFRELLKGLGFKWDAAQKAWWHTDVDVACVFMHRGCRQIANSY